MLSVLYSEVHPQNSRVAVGPNHRPRLWADHHNTMNAQQQQLQTPRGLSHKVSSPRRSSNSILCFVVAATALFANCVFLVNLLGYLDVGATGRLARPASTGLRDKKLAVVVPTHGGDLSRAVSSISRWPTTCSPVTRDYVDLVLYFAQGPEHASWSPEVITSLTRTGGRCFAKTRAVFGHLTDEVSDSV